MMPPADPGPSQYKGDQYKGSASTQVTVRDSEFFRNEQVLVNWCDGFSFTDSWVEGCYMPTCGKGKALFENVRGSRGALSTLCRGSNQC